MQFTVNVPRPHCFNGCRGLHAFKFAPGKFARHLAINDVISRAFASAQVPATKEPTSLSRSEGGPPDGMTLIPWQNGEALTWDVTAAATLADRDEILLHLERLEKETFETETSTLCGCATEPAETHL